MCNCGLVLVWSLCSKQRSSDIQGTGFVGLGPTGSCSKQWSWSPLLCFLHCSWSQTVHTSEKLLGSALAKAAYSEWHGFARKSCTDGEPELATPAGPELMPWSIFILCFPVCPIMWYLGFLFLPVLMRCVFQALFLSSWKAVDWT